MVDSSGRSERINRAGARTFGHSTIVFEPRSGGSFDLSSEPDDRPRFKVSFTGVDVDTGRTVQSVHPMLTVENRVLPNSLAPLENDVFVVGGVRYKVAEIEPRDNGTTRVHLRRL
jgi:hypothetical protein